LETNKTPHGWSRAGGMAGWVCRIGHISMGQKGLARYVKAGQHEKTCCQGQEFHFCSIKNPWQLVAAKFTDFIIYLVYGRQAL